MLSGFILTNTFQTIADKQQECDLPIYGGASAEVAPTSASTGLQPPTSTAATSETPATPLTGKDAAPTASSASSTAASAASKPTSGGQLPVPTEAGKSSMSSAVTVNTLQSAAALEAQVSAEADSEVTGKLS